MEEMSCKSHSENEFINCFHVLYYKYQKETMTTSKDGVETTEMESV